MVDGNAPAIRSARREELPGRVAKLPAADRSHPTCPQRCGGDEPGALSSGWRRAGAHLAPPGGGCRDCSRLSPSPADHPRRQAGASAARMSLWAIIRRAAMLLLVVLAATTPALAQPAPAQTIWRLLDYIAVDYAGAVSEGRIINDVEYTEMVEFSATVRQRLAELPPTPARAALVRHAETLEAAIAAKAPTEQVAPSARKLGRADRKSTRLNSSH